MDGVTIDGGVLVSVPKGSGTADLSDNSFDAVGPFVFTGEHRYNRVILPSGCLEICDKAFFYNFSIEYLRLGRGIEEIGTYALAGSNPLTEITVENGAVGFVAVGGVLYYGNEVVLGVNKPTITFKDNTSAIGERAFSFCDKITSLTIPETVSEIGRFAFSECSKLKSISIPSAVEEVGYGAFFGCYSIEEVSLGGSGESGDGVRKLDGLCFAGMPSLILCRIPNTIRKIGRVIGEESFAGCSPNLFFGKIDRFGYEDIVGQLPTSNIGDLGRPVRVVFHLGAESYDAGEVATGSSFGSLIDTANERLGKEFITIEGWYYDNGTFENECNRIDRVSNYQIIDGRIVEIRRIDLYAKYDATKFVITLDLGYDGKTVTSDPITYGTTVNIKDILVPYRVLYIFDGWYDEEGRDITDEDGDTWITVTGNVTIYARWQSNFGVYRFSVVSETKRECSIDEVLDWSGVYGPGNEIQIPSTLRGSAQDDSGHEIEVDFKVVSIAANVFRNAKDARSVSFPSSVRSIGSRCFSGCNNLEWVFFDEESECHTIGARAFESTAITNLNLPDSLKTIKQGAFLNCKDMTEVSFGGNVTAVGIEGGNSRGTFEGCDSLSSVYVPSLRSWLNISFGYASCNPLSNGAMLYANGSEVTTISSETIEFPMGDINPFAFVGCPSITIAHLTDSGILSIGDEAFSACRNFRHLTLPSHITSIGRAAFSNTGLEYIQIPYTLDNVGEFMFNGCASLTNVEVDSHVISASMFSNCPLLSTVYIGPNVEQIGSSAFAGSGPSSHVEMDSQGKYHLVSGMSISFYGSSHCDSIGDYAFAKSNVVSAGGDGMTEYHPDGNLFETPASVQSLGDYAFEGCYGVFNTQPIVRHLHNYPDNVFDNCPNAY